MVRDVPTVSEGATVGDIETLLLKEAKNFVSIEYVYVLGRDNLLKGVLSIKELFSSPKDMPVASRMTTDVVAAHMHTDQEHVALLAIEHGLTNVPVVDSERRFLGVVPHDTIVKVLDSEAIEDLLRMGGITHGAESDPLKMPVLQSLERRLPWLIIGMCGGLLAAFVVSSFEETLEAEIALAAFIPVVVYISDAIGTQVETIFIRRLTLGSHATLMRYFFREFFITGVIGLMIGALSGIGVGLWWQSFPLGLTVGASVMLGAVAAAAVAVLLPWTFAKLKFDPAVASGPLATVICDVSSLTIYFLVAVSILNATGA